jgi:hypothetical protein
MAGSFSDACEAYVLDTLFGNNATELSTAALANLYFALIESTADNAGDAWTPLTTGECPGSTYARKVLANTSTSWCNTTAGSGIKQLKVPVVVTTAAGADWGTIGYFAIVTAAATDAGWALCWTSLTGGAKVINSGDSVTITTALTITLG